MLGVGLIGMGGAGYVGMGPMGHNNYRVFPGRVIPALPQCAGIATSYVGATGPSHPGRVAFLSPEKCNPLFAC